MPLAVAFWGYGVVVSGALTALHIAALGRGQLRLQQGLIILSALYTAWALVAIWRCAANAAAYWTTVARWLVVAWGLNAALVLIFLQLNLLVRYAQG
jgi:hypothetical protein